MVNSSVRTRRSRSYSICRHPKDHKIQIDVTAPAWSCHGHVWGGVTTDDVSDYSAVKHEPRSFKTPSLGVEYRPFQHCRRSSPALSISSTEKSSFLGLWSQSAPCSRHVHDHALLPSTREFHCYLREHRQQCYTWRDLFHSQSNCWGLFGARR